MQLIGSSRESAKISALSHRSNRNRISPRTNTTACSQDFEIDRNERHEPAIFLRITFAWRAISTIAQPSVLASVTSDDTNLNLSSEWSQISRRHFPRAVATDPRLGLGENLRYPANRFTRFLVTPTAITEQGN